jgi:diguanylate cyclase (GGDEF)-like protein
VSLAPFQSASFPPPPVATQATGAGPSSSPTTAGLEAYAGWLGSAFIAVYLIGAVLLVPGIVSPTARIACLSAWVLPTSLTLTLGRRLRRARQAHAAARLAMDARSATVDRLLDFSQTVQGAGRPEQIFPALSHGLQVELGLAGVVIAAAEAEGLPSIHVRSVWPPTLLRADRPIEQMDHALCPCLRQNLPRTFCAGGSPVRCAIDASLNLSIPADRHAAYCIPFTIGRKTQVLVHMLLPEGQEWDEDRRQIAQTYVNTASSSLITLHHLAEAEKQSLTDGLTGLYNRRSMESLLQREVALAERYAQPLSVVMIDMDLFKEVNDAHGHAAGDHLLRAFADCVRMTLRKTDLAFRYGGDEFVIALPQTPIGQAEQVVHKLRQAFAAVDFSDAIAHLEKHPTLSIGVAERSVPDNLVSLPAIMQAADAALYEAKNASRNYKVSTA